MILTPARIPPAFRDEPFRSLSIGPPLYQHEVLETLKMTIVEFGAVRMGGYLKHIGSPCLPHYNRSKVVAFSYGLHVNPELAQIIGFLIGRRNPSWASYDGIVDTCGPYDYHHPSHPYNEE